MGSGNLQVRSHSLIEWRANASFSFVHSSLALAGAASATFTVTIATAATQPFPATDASSSKHDLTQMGSQTGTVWHRVSGRPGVYSL